MARSPLIFTNAIILSLLTLVQAQSSSTSAASTVEAVAKATTSYPALYTPFASIDDACNAYGTDITDLRLTVEYQDIDRLHVEITPAYIDATNSSWYVLQEEIVSKPGIDSIDVPESDLEFVWSNYPTFSFTVLRQSTGDILFSTSGSKLVYENQFIEFVTTLPENYNVYASERSHPFYLDTRYFEVNKVSGEQTYVANTTNATAEYNSYSHGVSSRNAHAQEVLLEPSGITWRALGGNIGLYFYSGPTQKEVTQSYQASAIGFPAMQQYFAFGYHQCRWGYANWSQLQDIVDNFENFSLSLETIWTDIDLMKLYRNFENDPNTFGYLEGQKFLSQLHAKHQHYVPIADSAIYIPNPNNASDAYPTFDRGNVTDSFILNPDGCGTGMLSFNPAHPSIPLPGEPGDIIYKYPEGFGSTNASEAASASSVSSSIAASASLASIASASSAGVTGSSAATATTPYLRTTPTPGVRDINYPPYVINNIQGDLAVHAISPNATHRGGYLKYDYHNLNGYEILNATYHALLNIWPTKRPFLLGRSTSAGSGKWAGHWGGDNRSQFLHMMYSIPQALSFSLFGIPMFGVDTCGLNSNTDEELCNRWMQLSAFFPFYRNHNILTAISQEPYVWDSVTQATKKAIGIRYLLLPYIYTTFHLAHTTGSTVMRALAWNFPTNLPWPILTANSSLGQERTLLSTRRSVIFQSCRQNPWGVIAALGANSEAIGELYVDDGESLNPNVSLTVEFTVSGSSLYASGKGGYTDSNALANITVLGVETTPSDVKFNDVKLGESWSYNSTNKVLTVTELNNATSTGAWSQDWILSWN
ncbi:hypothetical protein N7476_004870 [Penicillium atrosanguineum]|uniref:alpha-glucosidase n=1 Tax=Penicillium atrosanguineum TaxID=1132637 RepID=A0A9W9Q1J0_9EURO|nr:hypothetical protein N7526_001829 [Penicillium atrosanguineum]KAJ5318450.1 hypothetical protein N7476_004870 [Penicillium atrosanguineum]